MIPYVLIYIMRYELEQPEAHLASKKLVELYRTEFERRFREKYSSSPQIGGFSNGEPDDPYFTIDNDGYRPGTGFDSLNAKERWRETANEGLRLLWEVVGYMMGNNGKAQLKKLAEINEATCIDSDVDGTVNDLRNLFNVNM